MAGVLSKKPSVDTKDVHEVVLKRLHDFLLTHVLFDPLHDYLITKSVFGQVTLDDMKEETKNSDKIRSLLKILGRSDQTVYHVFLDGLSYTKQNHIVNKLKEMEKRIIQELILQHSSAGQVSDHYFNGTRSAPQAIPSSSITQPTSSVDGSPVFKDVHGNK